MIHFGVCRHSLLLAVILTGAVSPAALHAEAGAGKLDATTNSIGMELVLIPAGEFLMGSPPTELGHQEEELQHRVRISKPFHMGVYEVTQEQYERVMGKNPSAHSATGSQKDRVEGLDTRRFPVDLVSWNDAVEFCRRLSELPEEKAAGRKYRLPTEAEWEYACRAGTQTPFHFGNSMTGNDANCDGTYPYGAAGEKSPFLGRTTTVGSYKPNTFGLYDMHGNVWELCADWHAGDYFAHSPEVDPAGPDSGQRKIVRGGRCHDAPIMCRSSARRPSHPRTGSGWNGFRVVGDW